MKRTFPESELIINADGSCFHLHLKPEQLADKVVLVGDPARVDTVAAHFDSASLVRVTALAATTSISSSTNSTPLPTSTTRRARNFLSIAHSRWYASAPVADCSPTRRQAVLWHP